MTRIRGGALVRERTGRVPGTEVATVRERTRRRGTEPSGEVRL
ncbi:hypothetical protein [Nocardia stercoris]|nr:hypothetical protein [Nocardia stercoris]